MPLRLLPYLTGKVWTTGGTRNVPVEFGVGSFGIICPMHAHLNNAMAGLSMKVLPSSLPYTPTPRYTRPILSRVLSIHT